MTTREQNRRIHRFWPSFCMVKPSRSSPVWEGTLRPLCMTYRVKVALRGSGKRAKDTVPSVVVLDPRLRRRHEAPDEAIPHIYPNTDPTRGDYPTLCLYYPHAGEWHGGMAVANTIIPWTIEWLACYEAWLATGKWLGGGVHP